MDLTPILAAGASYALGALSLAAGVWIGRRTNPTPIRPQSGSDPIRQPEVAPEPVIEAEPALAVAPVPVVAPEPILHSAPVPQLAHQLPADGSPRYVVGWRDPDGVSHYEPGYIGDDSDRAYAAHLNLLHDPRALEHFYMDGAILRYPPPRSPEES